jgi:hypothetical protein
MRLKINILSIIVLTALLATLAQAGLKENARRIQSDYQNSVIWVEGVLNAKVSTQGQTRNQDQEIKSLGTVISEDGLTVVPNSSMNPSGMMATIMRGMGMSMEASLSEVKLLMPDGEEVAAEVILKDEDLDLAFLYPSEPKDGKKLPDFKPVDLESASSPQVLDDLVVLGRMPKFLNREPTLSLLRLNSIIQKPRSFYHVAGLDAMGVPVFGENGGLVGISVIRAAANLKMEDMQSGGVLPVVLPAEDVLEIARQARQEIEKRKSED